MNTGEGLARWLVQHAARNAPPPLSERLEEEWLADLGTRQGVISRLRFGVGCCWATRVIAYEHCAASVAATATTTGSKTMTAYVGSMDSFLSRRTVPVLLIIGLHAIIIFAFATGLSHRVMDAFNDRMKVVPVAPDPPPNKEPPPLSTTQPTPYTPRFQLPQVDDFKIEQPEVSSDSVIALPIGPKADPGPPVVDTRAVKRVSGGPGRDFPNADDFYPADAIRKGQQGTSIVRACVDEKGRLTALPTVARSSGTASLDEGALRLAKAGSGRYRATTEDGRPVSSCYEFLVTFHLKDWR